MGFFERRRTNMDELGLALHMETTNSGGIGLAFKLLTAGLFLEPDHHRRWGGGGNVPGTTNTEESTTEGTGKDERWCDRL